MRISRALTALLLSVPAVAVGQESRSFNFYVENDAFVNSDTGYTNGLRLAWALNRYKSWMPGAIRWAGPQAVLSGLGWLGYAADTKSGNQGCQPGDTRATRATNGRCYTLLLGLGQTMYSPSDLLQVNPDPEDRPFSGFLFGSIGAGFLDSPSERTQKGNLVMTQLSNEIVLGTTGPAAIAQETQSFAHWTWSAAGSPRPLGWPNQLKGGPQGALLTRGAFRWANLWKLPLETCLANAGCTGAINEVRVYDFTPRFETVLGSYMRRASVGGVLRLGCGFPDNLNADRIPTTKGRSTGGAIMGGCPVLRHIWLIDRLKPTPWFNAFFTIDGRYVQHNMFIEGGRRDGGPGNWKSISRIEKRSGVLEAGVLGFIVGTEHGSLSLQFAQRSPEYDVIGKTPFHGFHRFGSLDLAIHSRAY